MSKLQRENERRFTQKSILTLKATLEKRYRLTLILHRLNAFELFFMCEHSQGTKCTFVYFFRKLNGDPRQLEHALLVSHSDHTAECNQKRRAQQRHPATHIAHKEQSMLPEQDSDCKEEQQLPNRGESLEFIGSHNPESHSEKEKKATQSHLEEEFEEMQGQYFREEQLSALKKTLVHKYSGLVSKSTCFDATLNVITKIVFRCKNAQKCSCPFLQQLNLVPESESSPLYQLESKSTVHTAQCIMDCEDLCYHQMTRKIDESMEIIECIVRKLAEGNDQIVRPKMVLESLAIQLGEENGDFIYHGLQRRNNRRGVKKYFDNAVGKIRNRQKYEF